MSRAIVLSARASGRGSAGVRVEAALCAALREEAAPALVASVGTLACALVPGRDDDELFALAERVAGGAGGRAGRRGHGSGSGGRCPASTPGGASTRPAARWRRWRWGRRGRRTATARAGDGCEASRVATYKDLGSFQLLLSLQDDEALRLFCDSILGPIEASEGPYGAS